MVVYLTSFITDRKFCPFGTYTVNIEKEIKKYKLKNPGKKPTIVFDFCTLMGIFIQNNNEILSGGRLNLNQYKIETFLQRLKVMGIDLVFFDDGQIKQDKFQIWLSRVNNKYTLQCEIFENIKHGQPIDIPYKIQTSFCLYEVFLKIAKKYGQFFVSLHNECDLDCAAYASKVEPVAVVTMDTDFVIMPGDWPIWTTQSIDLERLTVTAWDKKAVRTALNLKQSQMPIFATLSGNNWVSKKLVDHIFRRFRGRRFQVALSELIRTNYPNGAPLSQDEFLNLVNIIYNNGRSICTMEEIKDMVNTSLKFYSYDGHQIPEISPSWLQKHIEKMSSHFLYDLVKDLPIVVHQTLIDLSRRDVRPYCELALPIIRKQLGIADYHRRQKNIERVIYLKPNHKEPYQHQKLAPIFPEFEIPPLHVLLGYDVTEKDNVGLMDKRWEIFCWSISTKMHHVKPGVIKNAENKDFIISALVLTYLVRELQIIADEADVMLLSIHEVMNTSVKKLEEIEAPERYNERAFWLAHVFLRLRQLYFESLILCGLDEYREFDSYDGFIFHKLYEKYLPLDSDTKRSMRKPIEQYRIYAETTFD